MEIFLTLNIRNINLTGLAVLCLDHPNIQSLIPKLKKRFTTYGLTTQADFQAKEITLEGLSTTFDVLHQHQEVGRLRIQMPGLHNVYNALATVATAFELEIPFQVVQNTLRDFGGIQRRFHIKGEKKGILIVDDYGHHPVEIMATLKAARTGWERRIIAVFQPHRYTRTQALFQEFLTAFYDADVLILTEIYPAGEDPIPGVEARALFEGIREYGHKDVTFRGNKKEIVDHLLRIVRSGDLVVTLGAGDIWQVGAPVATSGPGVASAMPEATPVPVGQPSVQAEAARPAPAREAPVTQAAPAPVAGAPATQPAAPTPEPTPVPTPTPRPRIVASRTALPIVPQQDLTTKTAKADDPVVAELAEDVSVDGDVLLPSGSEVRGHVVSALRSGRVKGRARLVVAFDDPALADPGCELSVGPDRLYLTVAEYESDIWVARLNY